ncbi:MAG TPA: DUF1361 domain-containing protein [Sediminibacterium sp.]|nr:DUF1361 domain-containing protein [Sediminibacterium sp.]
MFPKLSFLSKMMILSLAFSMGLLLMRYLHTHTQDYRFYVWNSFLAAIPYVASHLLAHVRKFNTRSIVLLFIWLLFLPNAPYMVTDVFHYEQLKTVPAWYDLVLVITGAWNGILLGILSLLQVQSWLRQYLSAKWITVFELLTLLLCGYGIFIGRYLRFNSWDLLTEPKTLAYTTAQHFLVPLEHIGLWGFSFIFAGMLGIFYYTLKALFVYRPNGA